MAKTPQAPTPDFQDMPMVMSKTLTCGLSENRVNNDLIATIVQVVEDDDGNIQGVAHPMDNAALDQLIDSLLNVRANIQKAEAEAKREKWRTQPPEQSELDKPVALKLKKLGFENVLDAYRAGPKRLGELGFTEVEVGTIKKFFRSHQIAWADPEDNPVDPRNQE